MSENQEKRHTGYLYRLKDNLNYIGIDPNYVKFILTEPEWFGYHDCMKNSLCDLIIGMDNETAIPVELKGSFGKKKRLKAIDQLYYGKCFVEEVLGIPAEYGKFVVYRKGKYRHEDVYF